ncbi:leucine-rich repeat domain-containing protein [[Clostridium] fimetarium]|uniref:Leucine-rich repeat (LRR) protein n=1 Tax=[Clostridium] fimetarium TaxID=99656 RepID=A0A1I0RXS6_9FIRM|nr:leucine-rich repeat domain-containing protein [[Clostridium] fimetarium]SEW46199.1 Leucine-rich repeat (LRR) protein [[Clostridium] fimetarium]
MKIKWTPFKSYVRKGLTVLISFLIVIQIYTVCSAESLGVIGDDVSPYSGNGSSNDPYKYLFDIDSKVTWKHLNMVKTNGYTEIYENRAGNTAEGTLKYSWKFSYDKITNPEGPYFLGINFYEGDILTGLPGGTRAKYFSFSNKRDLPGLATITMYVGDQFLNDTKLELSYYGGYDSAVLHGSTPIIDSNEIIKQDTMANIATGLTVNNGYVEFVIRYGGNYFLKEGSDNESSLNIISNATSNNTSTNIENITVSANAENSEETTSATQVEQADKIGVSGEPLSNTNIDAVYGQESNLGKINEVFQSESICLAIATSLSKDVNDEITVADIKSIKKLYLTGKALENINELGNVEFSNLESLYLSNNKIKSLPNLIMPMLKYIDLSNNEIEDIENIILFQKLESILIQNNKIKELFDISKLPNLVSLNASTNQIEIVPSLVSKTLSYMNLSNNKIKTIGNLVGLQNISFLDISSNYIKVLPDFSVCKNLQNIIDSQKTDVGKNNNGTKVFIIISVIVVAMLISLILIRAKKIMKK